MGISRLICVGPLDCIAGHIVAVLGVTRAARGDMREYYYHYRTAWWKWSEKWFHVKKFKIKLCFKREALHFIPNHLKK